MTVVWQETVKQLEAETQKLALECPNEIKRFHYGLITHSDAGKYSYNQYLGHFVHLYGLYFALSDFILPMIVRFAGDPVYSLDALKDLLRKFTITDLSYGGQNQWGEMAKKVQAAINDVSNREHFTELAKAYHAYVNRRYWWIHWYFPWGAGPAICPRVSAEDVKEMARLLENP
jgi:hypothetical protein